MFGRLGDVLGASRGRLAAAWGGLGVPLGIHGRFFRNFSRSCSEDGRKMGEVGGKVRPRWVMIAPRWAKMAPRWSVLA